MHWIRGVLGRPAALARVELGSLGAAVALDAGFAWRPWLGASARSLDDDDAPIHEYLDEVLGAAIAAASAADGLAFFETRYFGGAGAQVATAWIDGRRVVDCGTVNAALAAIGVVAAAGRDEWSTVGLERHRSMPR